MKVCSKVVLSTSNLDLSNMRESYSCSSQSFRGSNISIKKGVSAESLLDAIPDADLSEPRVSSGARRSLTRSNSQAAISSNERRYFSHDKYALFWCYSIFNTDLVAVSSCFLFACALHIRIQIILQPWSPTSHYNLPGWDESKMFQI